MNRLDTLESIADATSRLHREVHAIREAVARLASRLDTVQNRSQQLAALHVSNRDAATRLDRLEPILTAGRVETHVREAVRQTEVIEAPAPHAFIARALPHDIFDAAVDAIPPRIFFEPRGRRHELPVPPPLAPAHVIATWAFLADVVKTAFVPALVDRFHDLLDPGMRLTLLRNRLVLRQPGDADADPAGPSDWLRVVIYLTPPDANRALVVLHSKTPESPPLAETARIDAEQYIWEFRIGHRP